jgi:hypothetical protein
MRTAGLLSRIVRTSESRGRRGQHSLYALGELAERKRSSDMKHTKCYGHTREKNRMETDM